MKNAKKSQNNLRYLLGILFIYVLMGCPVQNNKLRKDPKQTAKKVESLNIEPLLNYSAQEGTGYDNNDKAIVLYHYNGLEKGAVIVHVDRQNHRISDIEYNNWQGRKLDNKMTDLITKCFCVIGLHDIDVDSCGNTYFHIDSFDSNFYTIIRDSTCLDKKYTYTKFNGNCYVKSI